MVSIDDWHVRDTEASTYTPTIIPGTPLFKKVLVGFSPSRARRPRVDLAMIEAEGAMTMVNVGFGGFRVEPRIATVKATCRVGFPGYYVVLESNGRNEGQQNRG